MYNPQLHQILKTHKLLLLPVVVLVLHLKLVNIYQLIKMLSQIQQLQQSTILILILQDLVVLDQQLHQLKLI